MSEISSTSVAVLTSEWTNLLNMISSSFFNSIFVVLTFGSGLTYLLDFFNCIGQHGKQTELVKGVESPIAKLKVPKRFFLHFYVVGICASLYCIFRNINESVLLHVHNKSTHEGLFFLLFEERVLLIMFLVHCIRRFIECLIISHFGQSTMNALGYCVGLFHYVIIPLSICNVRKSKENFPKPAFYLLIWPLWQFVVMVSYCLASSYQTQAHYTLYKLKLLSIEKATRSEDKVIEYSVPVGQLFEYIICPHYFTEILIYLCFCAMSFDGTLMLALVWVSSNLAVAADNQYTWYLNKALPNDSKRLKSRNVKRLFPFVW